MARSCHKDHETIIIKWAPSLAGGIMNGWYPLTYTPIKIIEWLLIPVNVLVFAPSFVTVSQK